MVTLSNADNVLKSFYLDAITETLNTKINPFLAKVEKTSENVTGKEVRKVLSCGFNNGIGAGTETGDLPTANGNSYNQIVVPLKNFYGTIEISDKALRASANSDGAFVNLLNDEMRTLVNTAKYNFGRMLFGNGSGILSHATSVNEDEENSFYVTDPQNFTAGMMVDVVSVAQRVKNVKITAVDVIKKCIVLQHDTDLTTLAGLCFVLPGVEIDGHELCGLSAIFGDDALYGLDRTDPGMKTYVREDADYVSDENLQLAIDTIEMTSGYKPNMILCSADVKRALVFNQRDYGTRLPTIQMEDGTTAIDYYGIPVVVDRFCPENTMYLLNTDFFKLHQLCDWQWLETEDGKILKQTPGKPVYTATLVKYAELVCDNPSAQGMIKFTEI